MEWPYRGRSARSGASFRHRIDHRAELLRLIVEHEVEVPEMPAGHVPVEVLRFHVEREDIGQQLAQRARDLLDTRGSEIGDAESGYIVGRGIGRFHGGVDGYLRCSLVLCRLMEDGPDRRDLAERVQQTVVVNVLIVAHAGDCPRPSAR